MTALRKLRAKVSLVAILALLLHSLMPPVTAASATPGSSSSNWIEVCSGGHVRLVPAGTLGLEVLAPKADTRSTVKKVLDDCSFCPHHGAAAARSDFARQPLVTPLREVRSILAFDVPDPLFTWAAGQSRGPPSLS